jgi:hypothetical protein
MALPRQLETLTPFEAERERRVTKGCAYRLGACEDIRERPMRVMNRRKGDVQAIAINSLSAQVMCLLQAYAQALDSRAGLAWRQQGEEQMDIAGNSGKCWTHKRT